MKADLANQTLTLNTQDFKSKPVRGSPSVSRQEDPWHLGQDNALLLRGWPSGHQHPCSWPPSEKYVKGSPIIVTTLVKQPHPGR